MIIPTEAMWEDMELFTGPDFASLDLQARALVMPLLNVLSAHQADIGQTCLSIGLLLGSLLAEAELNGPATIEDRLRFLNLVIRACYKEALTAMLQDREREAGMKSS